MLTYLLNIAFAIVATVLFIQAPNTYSLSYCQTLMGLFIVQNVLYFLTNKRKNWLGFEFFFALSFFLVNFVYPVFYAPLEDRQYWSFFSLPFNDNHVTRCTALAYFGYAWYLLGATRIFRLNREEPSEPTFTISMRQYIWFFGITMGAWLLFVATGGLAALQSVYAEGSNLRDVGIYSYFNNIFTIGCLFMAIFLFRLPKQKWWFYALVIIGFMLLLLSTGSRQMAVSLALILIVGFSMYVYHLKWWQVTLIVALGTVVLFLVMTLRTEGMDPGAWNKKLSTMRIVNFWDIFSDLTINDVNLFRLYGWAQENDLTWFQGMTLDITSPIPGMANIIIENADVPHEMLHGGDLPTYLFLGPDSSWGTGTNMIGEAYRSFGAIGTAIAMFLIGFWVKESYYRAKNSVYWYLMYFLLVGHALIYPRAPLLFDPRTVTWSLLLLAIVMAITSHQTQIVNWFNRLGKKKEEQA
ncbi:MAG: oligosaccharide repeat unit polymerase [Paludibacteraceae bacterium]|nr:oligosaccharide repeat unit polymerase [Paludibacteraceae bacterium]